MTYSETYTAVTTPRFSLNGFGAYHLIAVANETPVTEPAVAVASSLEKAKQQFAVDNAETLADYPEFEIIRVK